VEDDPVDAEFGEKKRKSETIKEKREY